MSYIGKEIFNVALYYNLPHALILTNTELNFGDGFEQRLTKNLAWSSYDLTGSPPRPDGLGNTGIAYRGINTFGINIKNMQHVNDVRTSTSLKPADKLWKFYQDRNGTYESFWFYNPAENGTVDTTGLTATGRYLVRFDGNLTREQFMRHLFNASITLKEVRS